MTNIYPLEIPFLEGERQQYIYPVLIQDNRDTILVDCAYPHFLKELQAAAQQHGCELDSVSRIIITHHDLDHMGSLAAIKREYPSVEIIAHEIEVPYIEGTNKSLRLEQAESMLSSMAGEARAHAESFIDFLRSMEPAPVDQTTRDREQLPWCGGVEVIHTPGHMLGHISLYVPSRKTLIAGDAVVIEEDGTLNIANPQYTLDLAEAVRSVERLLEYEVEQLICYHGGTFKGNVRQVLRQLIDRYKS